MLSSCCATFVYGTRYGSITLRGDKDEPHSQENCGDCGVEYDVSFPSDTGKDASRQWNTRGWHKEVYTTVACTATKASV